MIATYQVSKKSLHITEQSLETVTVKSTSVVHSTQTHINLEVQTLIKIFLYVSPVEYREIVYKSFQNTKE
jgi:hypothetical protein